MQTAYMWDVSQCSIPMSTFSYRWCVWHERPNIRGANHAHEGILSSFLACSGRRGADQWFAGGRAQTPDVEAAATVSGVVTRRYRHASRRGRPHAANSNRTVKRGRVNRSTFVQRSGPIGTPSRRQLKPRSIRNSIVAEFPRYVRADPRFKGSGDRWPCRDRCATHSKKVGVR
jgi:hypothetical protein